MRARSIRDDIHGDIPLSALDARVVDDPLFQRLREVRQSAGAHLVFPTMRVTRFEHSIGVMHTASLMLRHTLNNSEPGVRRRLLDAIATVVTELPTFDRRLAPEGHDGPSPSDLYEVVHDPNVTNGLSAAFDVVARTPAMPEAHREWIVALAVCEQALRLCALLHDVGHMPFSHDFELAVVSVGQDHSGAPYADERVGPIQTFGMHLHERVSLGLSSVLRDRIARHHYVDTRQAVFDQAAFSMARALLFAKVAGEDDTLVREAAGGTAVPWAAPESRNLVAWLYSLIDGELDADRADYILRDSAGYTFGTTAFDLSRFLHGIAVAYVGETGVPTTVVRRWGVSAVEGYFLARHRLYTDAIYHHGIQRATAGLRFATAHVVAHEPSAELDEFLDAVQVLAEWGASTDGNRALSQVPEDEAKRLKDAASAFGAVGDARMRYVIASLIEASESNAAELAWHAFAGRGGGLTTLWKRATEIPVSSVDLPKWRTAVTRSSLSGDLVRRLRDEGVILGFADAKGWDVNEAGAESSLLIDLSEMEATTPKLEPLSLHAPLFSVLPIAADQLVKVLAFEIDGSETDSAAVARRLYDDAVLTEEVTA